MINELLYFTIFYSKRITKSQLCDVVASFYHADELSSVKSLLCQTAASSGITNLRLMDGPSSLITRVHRYIERVMVSFVEQQRLMTLCQ